MKSVLKNFMHCYGGRNLFLREETMDAINSGLSGNIKGGARAVINDAQFLGIADFVLAENPDIPDSAIHMAAKLLIDTLGVTAGASQLAVSKIARSHAVRFMSAGEPVDEARILFDGRVASQMGAAFAAATQTDNLDAHDGFNPVKGHVGCAVVPALMAFAEQLPELSGREALEALVIAYEVAGRAGMALHNSVHDYHTSGAWNALGVAALGCRLLGADRETLRQALGIAEYHGPRSQMMREIDNPTMLHDGSGMGAMTGIQAVMLARDGFVGAPAITIEAREVGRYWEDLGTRWTIEENYIKPYPICRWAHAAIDGVRSIMLKESFAPEDVEIVHIRTFHEASRLFMGMPQSNSQAQYSLGFSVAAMLLFGKIGPQHIEGEILQDARVAAMLQCISVSEAKVHQDRFPAGRWSDVSITLKDGRVFHSGDTAARGGVEVPLSDHEFEEKFLTMVEGVLDKGRIKALWQSVFSLHQKDVLFSGFSRFCY